MKPSADSAFLLFLRKRGISLFTVFAGGVVLMRNVWGSLPQATVNSTILAMLVLIGLTELMDKSTKLDSIESKIDDAEKEIKKAIGLFEVRKFETAKQAHEYMCIAVTTATRSIHHASVGPGLVGPQPPHKKRLYDATVKKLREQEVSYYYVTSFFTEGKVKRVQEWLSDPLIVTFSVSHFPSTERYVPTIYFMIYDNAEVVICSPSSHAASDEYLATRDPLLVKLFFDYFELLWQKSEKIKDDVDKIASLEDVRIQLAPPQSPSNVVITTIVQSSEASSD